MTAIPARSAGRVLGAALIAGAEFVSAAEFAARVGGEQQSTASGAEPSPAHLAVHYMREDVASCLLLAGAEREEGIRGTYLVPTAGRDDAEIAVAVGALQRMGHRIGVWLPAEELVDGDAGSGGMEAMVEWLRARGVRRCDAVGSTADVDHADALRTLAARAGVPCWVLGGWCGGEEPRRPLFHVHDSTEAWTLDCTRPEYTVTAAAPERLTAEFLSAVCDLAARGSCLYTMSPELYR